MQGVLCFVLLGIQLYFKYHNKTMIFIVMPCHFATFLLGLVSILPFNRFSDLLMPLAISSCFGAWIGIAFAENGELSFTEHVVYYIQHTFAAFLAPFVIFLGGRYSPSDQMRWPLPYFGYLGFALYMRWFLTPLSAMTWANLNHTLCSVDNDPWKAYFGMGKHYFFWADFYLALTSIVSQYFIGIFGILLCTSFTAYPKNIKNR